MRTTTLSGNVVYVLFTVLISFCLSFSITSCTNLQKILKRIPDNTRVFIPTYDGNNQVVHPDILFIDDTFRMAITPYPVGNNKFENPSVYESADGLHFTELRSGINPLVKSPDNGFNCDPDLVYDKSSGTYYLYYLDAVLNMTARLNCVRWTDICHDTVLHLITFDLLKNQSRIGSPAFTRGRNDSIYMFFVNSTDKNYNYFIEYYKSRDYLKWDTNERKKITIDLPDNFRPWHLNVSYSEKHRKYYMICTGFLFAPTVVKYDLNPKFRRYENILAVSNDLKTWKVLDYILRPEDLTEDKKTDFVYRSAGIVAGNLLVIWYSYRDKLQAWHLGVKKYPLDAHGDLDGTVYFRRLYKDQPALLSQKPGSGTTNKAVTSTPRRYKNALAEIEKLNQRIDRLKIDTTNYSHAIADFNYTYSGLTQKNQQLFDSVKNLNKKFNACIAGKTATRDSVIKTNDPMTSLESDFYKKTLDGFMEYDLDIVSPRLKNNLVTIMADAGFLFQGQTDGVSKQIYHFCEILKNLVADGSDHSLAITVHTDVINIDNPRFSTTLDMNKARLNNLIQFLTNQYSLDAGRISGIIKRDVVKNANTSGSGDLITKNCFEFIFIPSGTELSSSGVIPK
jgi:hypothetical protein